MADQPDPTDVDAGYTDAPDAAPDTPATPVVVDNRTARDDNDGRLGHWVDVVDGEHAGRVGAYYSTSESDPVTGYPLHILVKTRDEFFELIEVAYKHVRPSRFNGGR